MAFYENRVTGKRSFHPKSGIGDSLNAVEIGEDGKPVKPRTSLAPSKQELKAAKSLLKAPTQTTEAGPGSGFSNEQEGDQ